MPGWGLVPPTETFMDKTEPIDETEDRWQTVPNRRDLRTAKLTLRHRRVGYVRRQAVKRMRLGYEVLA